MRPAARLSERYELIATVSLIAGSAAFAAAIPSSGSLQVVLLIIAFTLTSFGAMLVGRRLRQLRLRPIARGPAISNSRVEQLTDAVISRNIRRFTEPWLRPFPSPDGRGRRVILLPGAAYHLAEISPLADELERRGYVPLICVGEQHWSRTMPGLFWLDRPTYEIPSVEDLDGVAAIVTMKDWAGYRPLILGAQERSILTAAIVEGAQDFGDLHQPIDHRPYQTADIVLCQGANDVEALRRAGTFIVGSNRLEQLMRIPLLDQRPPMALINVNFTYGVLTRERDEWVASALRACDEAGVPWVLSVHPAARIPKSWQNVTRLPISTLLPQATVLISRFSTVPYEAMARGIDFVYHNPHGERMPAFQTPGGAFEVTTSTDSLTTALSRVREPSDVRSDSFDFLSRQVSVDPDHPPYERMADTLEGLLRT